MGMRELDEEQVAEIAKLELRDDDAIVVTSPDQLTKVELIQLRNNLQKILERMGRGHVPIIVLDEGMEMQVLRLSEVRKVPARGGLRGGGGVIHVEPSERGPNRSV